MQKITSTEELDLLDLPQASKWASSLLNKQVTPANIAYLVQYGKIQKLGDNGSTLVSKADLQHYYNTILGRRETSWKSKLGEDLNWHLSFDNLREVDTTKHVHRLHPYKGKFIPQLVEYFLDGHLDDFKKEACFKPGDIVLDPFSGSGTTMVQANELGMHAIGIDISAFNALLANIKVSHFDLTDVAHEMNQITAALKKFLADNSTVEFDQNISDALSKFNATHFPSPEFKRRVHLKQVDEDKYGAKQLATFLPYYQHQVEKFNIKLRQDHQDSFLGKWYLDQVRQEIDFVFSMVKKIPNHQTKKLVSVVLSRTIRSCRATTHADLATLKEPVVAPYYCAKHGKICKPLFSILGWWETYCKDTLKRVIQFSKLRSQTWQYCIAGDACEVNILAALEHKNPHFADIVRVNKIRGIFSSPPYVGLINYHEQHAYAYDLFGFERNDEHEIGRMALGQGRIARDRYVDAIASVLTNSRKFMVNDFDVFLVANDKYGLYPIIAERAGMQIIEQFNRPVLNRTERDKAAYSEIIFHLKDKPLC
ncbi:DNA methyltransferase [Ferrigenium sp. UT4]